MNATTSPACLSSAQNELLLGGDLRPEQEREVLAHLDGCDACRRALAQQAAEPASWTEAQRLLKPPPGSSEPDSRDDARALEPGSRQPAQIQAVLGALAPTDDPQMLGRLGSYEVAGVVGAGGMGVVLKAIDKSLDRTVAIKVLAPHLAASGAARRRFAREAKAAAAVLHPNVIAIHNVASDEPLPYLVMPYQRGASLQKRLDDEGPLPVAEVLRIGSQIAAGLAAAHAQGLVHRDIKPANILLDDGVERVTITDFGLARAVDDASLTQSGALAGTPQYMSPEQARGEPIDGRSDLFSLGSVLYAASTGRPPFRAETTYGVIRRITEDEPAAIGDLNPEIPDWLASLIARLMAKQPADRYASASEVADLLAQCLAHVQQPAAAPLPLSLIPPMKSGPSTSPSFRWSGAIAMITALVLGTLGLFLWQSAEPPDISGRWTGEGWGQVELRQRELGSYTGTYTDTFGKNAGTLELAWSRLERRFKGTWKEGTDRFGKISLRLAGDEVRGAWTASETSRIQPGNPELADLAWVRAAASPQAASTPAASTAGIRVQVLLSPARHSREMLDKNIGFDRLSIMGDGLTGKTADGQTGVFTVVMAHRCRLESFEETEYRGDSREPSKKFFSAKLFVPQDRTRDGSNLDLSQKRLDQLQEQGVQFWLDHHRDQFPSEATGLAELSGTVTNVEGQEHVEIGLGEYDGVRVGQTLTVRRGPLYVGQIKIVRVAGSKSVGRIERRTGDIRRFDHVSAAIQPEKGPSTVPQRSAAGESSDVLTAAQAVKQGADLYHSRKQVTVRLPVASVKSISVIDENGTKLQRWALVSDTTPDFSIQITSEAEAALKKRGVADVAGAFVGKVIEVTGPVYGVGLDLISRPDTIWTYHMDVNSLDQVRFLDSGSDQRDATQTPKSGDRVSTALEPGATSTPRIPVQLHITAPKDMEVAVADERGGFEKSPPFIVPARLNLAAGKTYRLKITNIAGREGAELYPTVEIGPTTPRTDTFLAHNAIMIQFTEEDFDQVLAGNFVTKVTYLPDPEFQELAPTGAQTLVSSRLEPGKDPIVEADRRGSILAVIHLGNKDVELRPGATAADATGIRVQVMLSPRKHAREMLQKKIGDGQLSIMGDKMKGFVDGEAVNNFTAVLAHGCRLESFDEAEDGGQKFWRATLFVPQDSTSDGSNRVLSQKWLDRLREQGVDFWLDYHDQLPTAADAPQSVPQGTKPQPDATTIPTRLHHFPTAERVHAITCSPDGRLIAVANGNPTFILMTSGTSRLKDDWKPRVELLDAETGKSLVTLKLSSPEEDAVLAATERVFHFEVTALAFSPDGQLVAIGTSIGQVKLFRAATGELIRKLDDREPRLADKETPENWQPIERAHGSVKSLALSPDGSFLATCGESFAEFSDVFDGIESLGLPVSDKGRLKLWSVASGALKHDLPGHSQAFAVAFSHDGSLLASAGRWADGSDHGNGVLAWDPQNGEKLRSILIDANGGTHSIAFSPTRKLAAFGSLQFDKENDTRSAPITIAYPHSGITEWQRTLEDWAKPKAFLQGGRTLAVLCGGKSIQLIDAETGQTRHEIKPADAPDGEPWNDLAIAPAAGKSRLIIGGGPRGGKGFVEVWSLGDQDRAKLDRPQ